MAGAPFWESGIDGPTEAPADHADPTQPGAQARTINATFSTHPWDTAFVAGKQLPGICEVLDGLTQIGIDNKDPDGKDGARLTVKGYRPGPFEISCVTWTREQDGVLQAIEDEVWRKPNKKTKIASIAVDVYHPALERRGIKRGALIGITFPKAGPFDGARTVHFKFIEDSPPGKKQQTKSNKDTTVLAPELKPAGGGALNDKPTPPSKDRKALGPGGPPQKPKNGSN